MEIFVHTLLFQGWKNWLWMLPLSKAINNLRKWLQFSQNEYDDKFKNMSDKVQKLEEETNLMKEELHVIPTTKPS